MSRKKTGQVARNPKLCIHGGKGNGKSTIIRMLQELQTPTQEQNKINTESGFNHMLLDNYFAQVVESNTNKPNDSDSTVQLLLQDISAEYRVSEIWMDLHEWGSQRKIPRAILLNKCDLVTSRNTLMEDLDIDSFRREYPGLLILPFCAHSLKDIIALKS